MQEDGESRIDKQNKKIIFEIKNIHSASNGRYELPEVGHRGRSFRSLQFIGLTCCQTKMFGGIKWKGNGVALIRIHLNLREELFSDIDR